MSTHRNGGKYPGLLLYIDDLFFMASIPGKAFKEVVLALAAYASDGEIPVHLKGQTLCIFNMLAVKVDANAARYDAVVERNTHAAENRCRAKRETGTRTGTETGEKLPEAAPEREAPGARPAPDTTPARFVPPSEEEVADYIAREGLKDCGNFYHFYAARGWMMGKTPMADWHSALKSFEDYHQQHTAQPPLPVRQGSFNDYEQRSYPPGRLIGGEIDLAAEARAMFGENAEHNIGAGKEAPS